MNPKYDNLVVYCNGCGLPMEYNGQWPRTDPRKPTSQAVTRYKCKTCRIVDAERPKGRPVIFSVVEPELVYDNVVETDGSFTSTLR